MNKKKKWLSQIKAKAEFKKKQSVDDALNEFEKEKVPYHWDIITWMSFGFALAMFMTIFVETLQENRMLKAMVAQNIKPTAQLKRTGFDFTQPVNEIDWSGYRVELPVLPKPYKDTNVEI